MYLVPKIVIFEILSCIRYDESAKVVSTYLRYLNASHDP